MTSFVALVRGINVGGKNLVSMADLADAFRDAGHGEVTTHGQSGNVLFESGRRSGPALERALEGALEDRFGMPLLVVVRSRAELAETVDAAPSDFGSDRYRSDCFFLKHPLTADDVLAELPELKEGVDSIAGGPGVLYFSRVAKLATKTRIQRLFAMPVYQQMTVRTWRVTTRLLELLDAR